MSSNDLMGLGYKNVWQDNTEKKKGSFIDFCKKNAAIVVAVSLFVLLAGAAVYGGFALKGHLPNPLANHKYLALGAEALVGTGAVVSAVVGGMGVGSRIQETLADKRNDVFFEADI